jgi:predicted lipoprotein with Yx(FWY)xxD motif
MRLVKHFCIVLATLITMMMISGWSGTASTHAASKTLVASPFMIKTTTINLGGKSTVVLTNQDGFIVYYHTRDTARTIACTRICRNRWHPVLFTGSGNVPSSGNLPGVLSLLKTMDGNQVLYNGHPLYTYTGDMVPGQANGQGFRGRWFVVTPAIAKI